MPESKQAGLKQAAPPSALPADKTARKAVPLTRGLLDYFPAALAEVAHVSYVANEQHNPGEPMHHARGKSTDHADCIMRHLVDRGALDSDGLRHSAKVAWRALALLQEELEAAGAPLARGARAVDDRLREYGPAYYGDDFCDAEFADGLGNQWICERSAEHLGKHAAHSVDAYEGR